MDTNGGLNADGRIASTWSLFNKIKQVTSFPKTDGLTDKTIGIISDSKGVLQAIAEGIMSSNLVQEAREYLAKLLEDNVILFIWVPGHSDVLGNDRVARLGAMRNFVGPEPVIGIGPVIVKRIILEICKGLLVR